MTRGVLILAGPTASGKTSLAVELANRFDAEIVGADSRQIYRGMPVGTAAPSSEQLASAPHHLIGFLDPKVRYSAAQFVRDALDAVADIEARGKRAIVAGGPGFYIRALCGDVALAPERDEAVRNRLAHEALLHPPDVMYDWLRALDAARAAALRASDRYRVLRALEIALSRREGADAPSGSARATLRSRGTPFVKAYLEVPASDLDVRIEQRVDAMLEHGLVEEAERLGDAVVAADAVGYPQALAYARGFSTYAELRTNLIRATRRYAKRQATWFRSERGLVRIANGDPLRELIELAKRLPGWEA